MTYRFAPHLQLLYIRGDGLISQSERVQALLSWIDDPEYPNSKTALCDFTGAESTPSMADLRELVEIMSDRASRGGPRKLAIVATKPIAFGVAREFKDFVAGADHPMEVRVFADVSTAWAWLEPGGQPLPA